MLGKILCKIGIHSWRIFGDYHQYRECLRCGKEQYYGCYTETWWNIRK